MVINDLNSHYEVGSAIILSCYVTEPNLSLVDINTTVHIKWSSHNEYTIHSFNNNFTYNLANVSGLSDAREYSCSYYLTSATENFYIKPSDVKTKVTNVTMKSECSLN